MSNSNRSKAAKKAAATMRNRREFVKKFSSNTLYDLVDILNNVKPWLTSQVRSLAAVKANLTRGTYSKFVTVKNGRIVKDTIGLRRL